VGVVLGGDISYKSLEFRDKSLVFENVQVADVLHSEQIRISVTSFWPFQLHAEITQPHFLLSPDIVRTFPQTTSSRWSVRATEGVLAWHDALIPEGKISFIHEEGKSTLTLDWEHEHLFVERLSDNVTVQCTHFPLEWVSRLTNFECGGTVHGTCHAEWDAEGFKNVNLDVTGKGLSGCWKQLRAQGNVSLQGELVDKELKRFRLETDNGALIAPGAALQELSVLATFHEAGTKWDCSATASTGEGNVLPFEMHGKEARLAWVEGAWKLGQATGTFSKDQDCAFSWEHLGSAEMRVLQRLVSAVYPPFSEPEISSGTSSGHMAGPSWKRLSVTTFLAEDLAWKNGACKKLLCRNDVWTLDQAQVFDYKFDGQWNTRSGLLELTGQKPGPWGLTGFVECRAGRFSARKLEGEIDGIRFRARGLLDPADAWAFSLDVPVFSGEVPTWFPVLSRGHISSLQTGFHCSGRSNVVLEQQLSLRFSEAAVPLGWGAKLDGLCGELYVSNDEVEFSGVQGVCVLVAGNEMFSQAIAAPRIRWDGKQCAFDVRLQGRFGDIARFAGTTLALDDRSHVMGQPVALNLVLDDQGLSSAGMQFSLREGIRASGQFVRNGSSTASIAIDKLGLDVHLQYADGRFTFTDCVFDKLRGSCVLVPEASALRIEQGTISYGPDSEARFIGHISKAGKADITLVEGKLALAHLVPNEPGFFHGKGCATLSLDGIESDLDGTIESARWKNKGPLHVHATSHDISVHGIDAVWANGRAEAELVQVDLDAKRWRAETARVHAWDADVFGDFEGSLDFVSGRGKVKEAFVQYAGATRALRDVHLFFDEKQVIVEGLFCYRDKWAKAFAEADFASWKGRVLLQEDETSHATICFSGNNILSVEGAFGGIEASLHAHAPNQLIGSVRFDAAKAAGWIPEDIGKAFRELEMGKNFELKGTLFLDLEHPEATRFQGIFSGKQVELFGYQLRTLLAQTEIEAKKVRIYDFQLSDSAGTLTVDEIRMQTTGTAPWTIEIPKLLVRDLRPSLLHAPGEKPDPLTPLVVRELTLTNLTGLLDEPKTYAAEGHVSFINSFKRQETLFDKPSHLFGRILGLDAELLIPVTGEFLFTLKDGQYRLHDLKNAYSEAERSEFFLMEDPHMSLDGNLHILVQMKQFVLFKFTESFVISIEGTLKKPEFHLRKKKAS